MTDELKQSLGKTGRMVVKNTLGAVLLYAFIVAALAQQPMPSHIRESPAGVGGPAVTGGQFASAMEEEFQGLDRDRSGFLTLQELGGSPAFVRDFDTADRNGDGKIDRAEFESLRGNSLPNRTVEVLSPLPSDTGTGAGAGGTQSSGR